MTGTTIKKKPIYGYYLLLADSIKTMLGTCQKEVNYHWFSCDSWHPRGVWHVWGRSVKIMSRIDCRCLLRLPHLLSLLLILRTRSQFCFLCISFFFALAPSSFPLSMFWKCLLCRLTTTPSCSVLNYLMFTGKVHTWDCRRKIVHLSIIRKYQPL